VNVINLVNLNNPEWKEAETSVAFGMFFDRTGCTSLARTYPNGGKGLIFRFCSVNMNRTIFLKLTLILYFLV
jgi:hypothetical protein